MKTKPSLWQMVLLLMLPQVAETIYSPALTSIADAYAVSYSQAAQTLSVYFGAFALGVVVWGVLADRLGRRITMLLGLMLFVIAASIAISTASFTVLMMARALSAFGIAVGSVVTQTMLRDCFTGEELSKVFAYMGIGISISPVLGMLLGSQLSALGGHKWVFLALLLMALAALLHSLVTLPETKLSETETKQSDTSVALKSLALTMLKDRQIWLSALLVSAYNAALFSYYQLGAFTFAQLGMSNEQFGYSGIVLGLGTLIGSYLNKALLARGNTSQQLLRLAALLLLVGGIGVWVTQDQVMFLLPMMLVVMSFGIAIPNVLSKALIDYRAQVGSAGALFGLLYYLLIGGGLALVGVGQNLGVSLVVCGVISVSATYSNQKKNRKSELVTS
ncbi:multidrug effflux MFS transporter [Vibrio sp. THAF190c]|uniref:multidrug effflux MFS transporter n=1 Tax=Vibrio sp. THAF190c TaxID=2587865 RepID=UPI001268540B|nr:multidrug effflux MFS transporter [Vibrio sp. THAF190c]QFT11823.1 Inner membrane transport protein YdhC [Vibrio sp. THAF190c]